MRPTQHYFSHWTDLDFNVPERLSELQKVTQLDDKE